MTHTAPENLDQFSEWRNYVVLYVNGKRYEVRPEPKETLLHFLRNTLRLTGTKLGCGEGGCGACTVTVTRYEPKVDGDGPPVLVHRAVNACLVPVCGMDGAHVTTVEGVGTSENPHEIQKRMAEMNSSQCGFCTPGVVMSLYSKLQGHPNPTLVDIEEIFDGNLCRCTGYRPILDAAKTFACDCDNCPHPKCIREDEKKKKLLDGVVQSSTQEKIVKQHQTPATHNPPKLADECLQLIRQPVIVKGEHAVWLRPTSLNELLKLKAMYPHGKLIGGNTEIGIETKFKYQHYSVLINTASVTDLFYHTLEADGSITVGGAVTLSQLIKFLKYAIENEPSYQVENHAAIVRMMKWFASTQIRNVATFSGNICTASPISDINPMLLCANATLTFKTEEQTRDVNVREFFKGYRRTDMNPKEVLVGVKIPGTRHNEIVESYKQARRREDDISIVCAGFRALVEKPEGGGAPIVKEFYTGFGGMAPTTINSPSLEELFTGMQLDVKTDDLMRMCTECITKDFPMAPNVPGGMPAYRPTLAASFAAKFYALVQEKFGHSPECPSQYRTFLNSRQPLSHGEQSYKPATTGVVGENVPHRSALLQTTGEAKYADDIPAPDGTLHAGLILSQRATGIIKNIDVSKALAVPECVAVFTGKDIADANNKYPITIHFDEEVFRKTKVTSTGQILGVVLANNHEMARYIARQVEVQYVENEQDAPKVVTSIKEAIKEGTLHATNHDITDGNVDEGFKKADVVIEGEMRMGGQEHFYIETNASLAIPGEEGGMAIHASTQNPHLTSKTAANAIGSHIHKVTTHVKRMGGGFGGKESRTVMFSTVIAFAAHKLKRPVRIQVERDEDMWTTGTRHPFMGKYKIGATKDGKVVAGDIHLYNNAGYSADLSESVMDRALFHSDNVYKIPNFRVNGHICMTNTASNTAFRGFGGPQGLMVCETWIEHLARELKIDPQELRELNMYKEGEPTHFGQPVRDNRLTKIWEFIIENSEVKERQKEVEAFNKEHRWRKRGIAVIPTKFGINFTAGFLNQGTALVNIYTDGTVLITIGGTEMGQGLYTKVIQVAAESLGCDVKDVHIAETATDKVPNASPTAASTGTDIYGQACKTACDDLRQRLEPFFREGKSFKEAAHAAHFNMVSLSAVGFFRAHSNYDFNKKLPEGASNHARGEAFNYFTFGASCSEVEIDALTGDWRILRSDIVMDLGNSINPAIDIGQIEGAFMQGTGWCMMEECVWGTDEHTWLKPGTCFTRGPGVYKIPAFNDVPIDLRVSLLPDAPNPRAVHASKAVGEPPFFTASSVYFAARNAIAAARKDVGLDDPFVTDTPLTPERIRMACGDSIAEANLKRVLGAGGPERPALFC